MQLLHEALPWIFVATAAAVAAFTANGFRPIRRTRLLVLPSFLAGTMAAELAAYSLVAFLALGGVFVWVDMGRTIPGTAAAVLVFASALAMTVQVVQGFRSVAAVRGALATLPNVVSSTTRRAWRLLLPFPLRLSRSRVTRNIEYARIRGQKLRLDVYHPPPATAPRPAVLHVHGGGWVVGDKREQGVPLMTVLSDRGFVGFNVNYRLSAGATWPEHLIDVKRAIAWVREHAAEYGVDPRFVAVTGGSAGGHIISMAALTQNRPEFQPGFEDADTSVQAAVSLYGIYDLTDDERHVPGFMTTLLEPLVIKAFVAEEPERFAAASPLHRVAADAPPFFVLHGDRDSLAPLEDAQLFVERLRSVSSNPVLFAELPGAHHSFDLFLSPRSLPTLEGIADFLQTLRPGVKSSG